MLSFVRTALQRFLRFRNGLVHELYSLKASQMCKAHTTCEFKLRKYWQNGNSRINNYDAETNTSFAEKSRMFMNTTSKAAQQRIG